MVRGVFSTSRRSTSSLGTASAILKTSAPAGAQATPGVKDRSYVQPLPFGRLVEFVGQEMSEETRPEFDGVHDAGPARSRPAEPDEESSPQTRADARWGSPNSREKR
jgi:hypothetical protein